MRRREYKLGGRVMRVDIIDCEDGPRHTTVKMPSPCEIPGQYIHWMQGSEYPIVTSADQPILITTRGNDAPSNPPRYKAWYGGECPVVRGGYVDIVLRNGHTIWKRDSRYLRWIYMNDAYDIIAYRELPFG